MQQNWCRSGLIFKPKQHNSLATHIGPSFIKKLKKNILEIYYTHRDKNNISKISKCHFDIQNNKIISSTIQEVLIEANYGYFDQDGVSYPSLVNYRGKAYMFYVGWIRNNGKKVPFQNRIGLCKLAGRGKRVFKHPVIGLSKYDELNTGSCFVQKINNLYFIYYTSFKEYKKKNNTHFYSIKYATSKNLINWKKNKNYCISFKKGEFAISKPSIIFYKKKYHMWFCSRGENYKIGYAYSSDGKKWVRKDHEIKIVGERQNWESKAMAYPSVIKCNSTLIMTYNGNKYGKTGLGMMKMELAKE